MRLWILLTLAAAACGYLTWGPCLARAQAPAAVVVAPDGTVTGVPQVEPAKAPEWVLGTIRTARDLARSGQWGPFVALLLTALASVLSLALRLSPVLWAKVRPHLGYVTIGLTLAMYLAGNLAAIEVGAGAMTWASVIGRAVLAGMAACGGWELVLKPLLRKLAPKLAELLGVKIPAEPPKP